MKITIKNPADSAKAQQAARIARQFKRVRAGGPNAERLLHSYRSIVDQLGYDPIA